MDEKCLQQLQDAQMVLVGIGEAFDGVRSLRERDDYEALCKRLEEAGKPWLLPALNRFLLEKEAGLDRRLAALERLRALLEGKNFFLVSVSTNDLVWDSGIRQDRIVAPCGGSRFKQCINPDAHGGKGSVLPLSEEERKRLEDCARQDAWEDFSLDPCPVCGSPMACNNIYAQNYDESGYLDRWSLYTKWLQGSMNRRLCILELGVGLQFPSVIRFPFEKLAYYNLKSSLIRVHPTLPQLPQGLGGRGSAIGEDAVSWLLG